MSFGWNGADPAEVSDPDDYELGTRYTANGDITVTAVRVWQGVNSGNFIGRKGRLWSAGGVEQANVAMSDVLPAGWTEYPLAVPFGVPAGTTFWVSYSTITRYGVTPGIVYPVPAADGLVAAQGQAFNATPGSFPVSVFGSVFYGIDVSYVAGLPGANPLNATLAVAPNGLTVVATVGADRAASFVVEWGDGTSTSTALSGSISHTYAQPGRYTVLLTATDPNGIVDAAATCIDAWLKTTMHTCLTRVSAYDLGVNILTAMSTALATTTGGAPKRSTLVPGAEIPWDNCQCGTLSLAVTNRYASRNFPATTADQPVNCCNTMMVYEMSLSIVRCVPGMDADAAPPSPAALGTAFKIQDEDAFVLWTELECILKELYTPTGNESIAAYIINDEPTLGASGNCAGVQVNFKVAWNYDCAACG